MLFMFRVCHGFLPCCHLMGKGWPLGSLVCDVFFFWCFCHFPVWYPGSGVVLDCNDS